MRHKVCNQQQVVGYLVSSRSRGSAKVQHGFALMEALIVVALIGIVLAIAIPLLATMLRNWRVQTAASQFAVQLRFARNAAVKQKYKYRIVINEANEAYRVEKETDYGSGTYELVPGVSGQTKEIAGDDYVTLPEGVTIDDSSTDGPIVFNYRGANDGQTTYDIKIDTVTNVRYTITVTPSGGITTSRSEL